MKKLLNTLLPLCFFWMFTASKCKKDELPPETQEGKNTFGCYVNGELFVPGGGGLGPTKTCYYQSIYSGESGYVFHVSGVNNKADSPTQVAINIDSMKIYEGLSIELGNGKKGQVGGGLYFGENVGYQYIFHTDSMATGILTFNKFDEINHIAAGTFWFTAVNSLGETIHITDGRFDMKYTR